MVLIDLQKAFDTVNHEILLQKLSAIGLHNNSVKWFKSYLSGRTQFTVINGTLSEPCNMSCGVPQGSILGPLLFLIYVNDMCSSVSECNLYLYADDSAITFSSKSVTHIEQVLSQNLEKLSTWLIKNKLSLHLGKTECIIFSSKRKIKKLTNLKIKCNNTEIDQVSNVKYLGAYLDNSLAGTKMYEQTIKKINNTLKFLYRKKLFLNYDLRKTLVNSLIQPRFDYACITWYPPLNNKHKQALQITQNKCIRFIMGLNNRTHIDHSHFGKLNLLNVENRVNYLTLNQMFNIKNNKSPKYMQNLVNLKSHNHNTRYSQNSFSLPHVNCHGKNSLYFKGSLMWNTLPPYLKNLESKSLFKKM
jgi:hypothetical protein